MTKKSSSINEYLRKRAEVKEVASVNSNNITKKRHQHFGKDLFRIGRVANTVDAIYVEVK